MPKRIGILGGTFDPIHYGHLAIAEEARVVLNLDRVLLIPAAQQPLKPHAPVASASDRLAMVRLACEGSAFEPSAIELRRPGPSYTVTTLEQLHAAGHSHLYLILGTDALADLPRWHQPERIIELAHIVAVGRPQAEAILASLYGVLPGLAERLSLLDGPQIGLSSSLLRERVATGRPIRYLTPDAVVAYIAAQRLYRRGEPAAVPPI